MNTRFVLIALLLSATVAHAADGIYQPTKDDKVIVWNPDPRHEDAATWSGGRDGRYATGYGTLTWYRVERKFGLGSRLAVETYIPVVRYSGKMVLGKLNGLVVAVDNEGKKSHATFADGSVKGEWTDGSGPSATAGPVANQTPADQKPDEPVQQATIADAPAKESSPAASPTPERPPSRGSSESVREQSGATSPASQPIVDRSGTDLPSQKLSGNLQSSTATPRAEPPVNERAPKRTTMALPEHFSAEPTPIPQHRPSRGPDATSPAKEHVAKNTTMALPAESFSPEPTPIPELTANKHIAQPPAMKLQAESPAPILEHPPSPSYGGTDPSLPSDSESIREQSGATGTTNQHVTQQPAVEIPSKEPLAVASPSATSSPVPDRLAEQRVSSRMPSRGRAQADDLLRSLVIPPSAIGATIKLRAEKSPPPSMPSSSASPSISASSSTSVPPPTSVPPSTSVPPKPSASAPSPSPPARPRLTTEEVIGLADVEARKQGYDAAGYQCAKMDYTVADDKWSVWYDQKPAADGMIDVGKRFAVTIEDKTKKTSIAGK